MIQESTLCNSSSNFTDLSPEGNTTPSRCSDVDIEIYEKQQKILLNVQINCDNPKIRISGNNIKVLKDSSSDTFNLEVELEPQQSSLNRVVPIINSIKTRIKNATAPNYYVTIVTNSLLKLPDNVDFESKNRVLQKLGDLIGAIPSRYAQTLAEDICASMQFGTDLEGETPKLINALSDYMMRENTDDLHMAAAWTKFYEGMLLTAQPEFSKEEKTVAILDFYRQVLENLDPILENDDHNGPFLHFMAAFDFVEDFMSLSSELMQPLLDEIVERVRSCQDNIYVRSGFVGLIIIYSDNEDIKKELIKETVEKLNQDLELNQDSELYLKEVKKEINLKCFFDQVIRNQGKLFGKDIVIVGKKGNNTTLSVDLSSIHTSFLYSLPINE